jgi:hypothetical protein
MLAHLDDHYGGPASYLTTIGLRPPEVQQIRARLRTDAEASL